MFGWRGLGVTNYLASLAPNIYGLGIFHVMHIPVMLGEVLATLAPKDGETYIDGTFGAGGYTRAILEAADCKVYAIDRDPDAIARARKMAAEEFPGRLHVIEGRFGSLRELLSIAGIKNINGIVLDVGVSSMQIDTATRGFSFQQDGPLDMRMSQEGLSAADVVTSYTEKEIADILFNYGDERASRAIARKIVEARKTQSIQTTKELVKIVHSVLPMHGGLKTDTATKTFQALRIFVNDELGELERALEAAEHILVPGGRLVVVSFHSLEDGRVKNFLRDRSGKAPNTSRHLPPSASTLQPTFFVEKSSGLKPSDDEIARNPRARSAHLRYAVRTDAFAGGAAHA